MRKRLNETEVETSRKLRKLKQIELENAANDTEVETSQKLKQTELENIFHDNIAP